MNVVLVTGASGFVGRHTLAPLLERGYDVHAVARSPLDDDPRVHWHKVDLHDATATARVIEEVAPSHLLHLAWYAVPGAYWTSPENVRWVESSLSLLRAFAAAGGRRAVLAGTCAEYDWTHGLCSEFETPLRPAALYGTCKHALQLVSSAYGRETGLSVAWGRIFFLYGPHEPPGRLVSSVVRALLAGEAIATTDGRQVRDYLHVADVASAFVALLASAVEGPVNIGSGEGVAVRDVLVAVEEATGRSGLIRIGERETPPDDPPSLVADVGRLRGEVGWRPSFSLASGIGNTVEWRSRRVSVGASRAPA